MVYDIKKWNLYKQSALVSGGCGFIGSNLVNQLVEKDFYINIIDDLSTGNKSFLKPNIATEWTNKKDVKWAFLFQENLARFGDLGLDNLIKLDLPRPAKHILNTGYTAIYHLAAQANLPFSMTDPFTDAITNVLGTINLLNLYPDHKFIFTSTSTVYGQNTLPWFETSVNPECAYGLSKLTAEKYIQMFASEWVILRLANIFGPNQTNVAEAGIIAILFENYFKDKETILYGNGEAERDFLFVDDLVAMLIKAIEIPSGQIINCASGTTHTINQLLDIMKEIGIPIEKFKLRREKEYRGNWEVRKAQFDMARNRIFFKDIQLTDIKDALMKTFLWNEQYWTKGNKNVKT